MTLNDLSWKRTKIILSFLRLHPSTLFWIILLTMRATLFLLGAHSNKYNGHLKFNSPILVHFSSLIPNMLMQNLSYTQASESKKKERLTAIENKLMVT